MGRFKRWESDWTCDKGRGEGEKKEERILSRPTKIRCHTSNAWCNANFISILVGRGDVLDLVWVVSSDGTCDIG